MWASQYRSAIFTPIHAGKKLARKYIEPAQPGRQLSRSQLPPLVESSDRFFPAEA